MEEKNSYSIIKTSTTLCRFVLALVFIFSGFVKAIDPLGTQYKIQDYVDAFGWSALVPDVVSAMVALSIGILEFFLGICLFFGIRRIIVPYTVAVIMLFMTPLTFWLAIDNPISDCGCFGDAVVLSNWETFWKNMVLLVMALLVAYKRKYIFPLVTTRLDWLITIYGFIYIFIIEIYCYTHLPIFDFRPYSIGSDIVKNMTIPEGEKPTQYETLFTMKKDGVEQVFTIDNYPDSTWTFVNTKTIVKEKGYEPAIQDFSVLCVEDGEDMTEQILHNDGYVFLLISHQLGMADDGNIDLINELYDYSLEYGYGFYCLTSSSEEEIQLWKENTGAEYPFCQVDNITLKTMIRSNPGLMLLRKGVVLQKWSTGDLPDEYELTGPLETLTLETYDSKPLLYKIILVLSWFVFPLMGICLLDIVFKCFTNKQSKLNNE